MLFFDDFVKKIKNASRKEYRDREKFYLELPKLASVIGISLPMILLALFQVYEISIASEVKPLSIIVIVLALFGAYKQLSVVLKYKLEIDKSSKVLKYEKMTIPFSEINDCFLLEAKLGTRGGGVPAIDLRTKDGKQYVIPLIMNRKFEFVHNLKQELGKDFQIVV